VGIIVAILISISPPRAFGGETSSAVLERSEVTIGVPRCCLPFSYVDGEGEDIACYGFDIEVARAVAKRIGVEPRFVPVDPREIIPLVAEGYINMAPGITHTMSWEMVIDFSVTYFELGKGIMVLDRSGLSRLNHMTGKKIATTEGTKGAVLSVIPDARLVLADDMEGAISLLEDRTVSGVAGDKEAFLEFLFACENPKKYRLIKEPLINGPRAIGLPPDDSRWKELVDFSLIDLYTSGEYTEIFETWFGKDSPTRLKFGFEMEVWPR
jgi:polar amino acid transport system substrate-binding protein